LTPESRHFCTVRPAIEKNRPGPGDPGFHPTTVLACEVMRAMVFPYAS